MNDVTIRPATLADTAAVAVLTGQLGYPVGAEEMAARLRALGPHDAVLVAERGDTVLGMAVMHLIAMLHVPGPVGRLSALVVDEAARGQGAGALLLAAAEEWCAQRGCAKLELTSNEQRVDAHRFYSAHGYAVQSLRFIKALGGQS